MSTSPEALTSAILVRLFSKEQVDSLQLDIINMLERTEEGELDLLLEQPKRTVKQNTAFIATMIRELQNDILADTLKKVLLEDGDLEFFGSRSFLPFLKHLEKEAEAILIIPITLAIQFKEADLRDMTVTLSKQAGRKVVLAHTVDRTLIGGAIVRYGNYLTDYSLKARLEQFRTHWHKAVVAK